MRALLCSETILRGDRGLSHVISWAGRDRHQTPADTRRYETAATRGTRQEGKEGEGGMSAQKDVSRSWPLVYAPGMAEHSERD